MKDSLNFFKKHRKIAYPSFIVLFFLLISDLFIHKHSHYHVEDIFGFYSLFGFLGCGLIIIGSKFIGKFLCKNENYYE